MFLPEETYVDVINEFASSKDNEDMEEEVAARSKPRNKKKKTKKTEQ